MPQALKARPDFFVAHPSNPRTRRVLALTPFLRQGWFVEQLSLAPPAFDLSPRKTV
jgi:hypothetical protein